LQVPHAMPGHRTSSVLVSLQAALTSIPVMLALAAFNLCGDVQRASSSLSRMRWEHGWPFTYLWRRHVPWIDPDKPVESSLLPSFWSPRWLWWDLRHGDCAVRFEAWALVADTLMALLILSTTFYCVRRLYASRTNPFQFNIRFLLTMPVLLGLAVGLYLYDPRSVDFLFTALLLGGLICTAVVCGRLVRFAVQHFG